MYGMDGCNGWVEDGIIPDSRFPILNSRFNCDTDRIRSIFPSIEYLHYPKLVPQVRYSASLHSKVAPQPD